MRLAVTMSREAVLLPLSEPLVLLSPSRGLRSAFGSTVASLGARNIMAARAERS